MFCTNFWFEGGCFPKRLSLPVRNKVIAKRWKKWDEGWYFGHESLVGVKWDNPGLARAGAHILILFVLFILSIIYLQYNKGKFQINKIKS